MSHATWSVVRGHIEEHVVPGKPLGRHIRHDSRSRLYPHQRRAVSLVDKLWPRHIPILNQGDVGACCGNAEEGALGTEPLFGALSADQQAGLGEPGALSLYSAAEKIDGGAGYPPQDDGTSGLSVCQAAKNAGLIVGYTHCFSLADLLDALQSGPAILGFNWYDSFDNAVNGLLVISPDAAVRGGHETLWRGLDTEAQMLLGDNSWGDTWGAGGSMKMSYDTATRLLSEQGDATVPIPLGQPAPAPVTRAA